jgi:hypothetical protein
MADTTASRPNRINKRFLRIARDPRIIPGVHHWCDEWCDYCPVTDRCLAYRCTDDFRRARGRAPNEPSFQSMEEAIELTRELAAIEGLPTDELDALVDGREAELNLSTDDPLASLGLEYAIRALRFVSGASAAPEPPACRRQPAPADVVLWFHARIYFKLTRALIARTLTASGTLDRREDAVGCAKLTLVSIDRSRTALRCFPEDPRRGVLTSLLDAIEKGVEERFPEARAFLRVGLDVPAG